MRRSGRSPLLRTILICTAGALSSHAVAQRNGPPRRTMAYASQSPVQKLDIYRPTTAAPAPLVVYVHGGGWIKGGRHAGIPIAAALTAMGYVVASIDYRMPPEGTVADEAADVATATAFLLAHAAQFGIDASHFSLAGHSSGAHLVALVATDPTYARAAGLDLNRLSTVVTLDGVFDVALPTEHSPVFSTDHAARLNLSPVSHANQVVGHPLFCLIHEDRLPRFTMQADEFAAALRKAGQAVSMKVVPGLGHGEMNNRFNNPDQPLAADARDCLQRAPA